MTPLVPDGGVVVVEPLGAVQLTIASDPRQVRLARLIAGGFGSLAGLDVDALDDLRISIDEVCTWLIEHGDGSEIDLGLAFVDGAIEVVGTTAPGAHQPPADDTRGELALQILL